MRPGPRRSPEEGGEGAGGARGTGPGAAAPVDAKGFGIRSPPRLPARLRIAMVIPVSLKYRGPGRAPWSPRLSRRGAGAEVTASPWGRPQRLAKRWRDKGCPAVRACWRRSSRGVRRALFPGFRSWQC